MAKREWSEELIERTQNSLGDLSFGFDPRGEGKVCLKKSDGTFGYITLDNALKHKYLVVNYDTEEEELFNNPSDLTDAGWVLD